MAGIGKNSRAAKRGSSSSSSSSPYVSTTTMLLFVGFCLFGVYMLTTSSSSSSSSASSSSSSILSHAQSTDTNNHHHRRRPHKRAAINLTPPRSVLRDPPPSSSSSSFDEKAVTAASAGTEEDTHPDEEEEDSASASASFQHPAEERQQQDEEVETRRSDEQATIIQNHHDEDPQQQQPPHEETIQAQSQIDTDSNEEQQQQQSTEDNNEEQQQQTAEENNEQQQQQQEEEEATEQNNDEQQQQQQQQQGGEQEEEEQQHQHNEEQNIDKQPQGESSGQEDTNNIDDESLQQEQQQQQQQKSQTETSTDDIQDQNQEHIQEVTDETQSSHSQDESEAGGITSQSQIEHDIDGTIDTRHQQQQQQQEQEQHLQQLESENAAIGGGDQDNLNVGDPIPDGGTESGESGENKSGADNKTWATQADQSSNEKERRKGDESSQSDEDDTGRNESDGDGGKSSGREWELCNVSAGPDYIPCLDNEKAIKQLHSFRHFEHRERHCPEESPTCLVPLPKGYRRSIEWPKSRDMIWYNNVPRTKLAEVKGHQNWVKVTGEYLTFPGGGTQFIHGALHYIDFIQKSVPEIAWGKHTRVILDVGCGVASFGGYLFDRDVLAMSFAPKDEHEAQVQFALERGIPAISAVMGSQRLPFPSRVFDIVHCARCRVPWHANDGALLLELNRVLRPGGFFVWSATPVYQKLEEDVQIWKAMTALTKSMCWELHTIKRDKLNSVGAAMYRKPITNDCYDNRKEHSPPMCKEEDDPNAAWYVPLQSCMHRVPVDPSIRGSQWPQEWPRRAKVPPYWLNSSHTGVYGRPAPEDFTKDYEHWKRVVTKSYLTGFGIDWSRVRNVMDMRAVYGGFAAALKDMKVWVMNLVNIDSPDTLPIIYERGLFGMYHDWCESFSTYPRTYDLLHADRLFSQVRKRCEILPVIAEVDRIVRPGGKLIVRDESEVLSEVENILKSLHWEIRLTYSKNQEGILCAEKSDWRPEKISASA